MSTHGCRREWVGVCRRVRILVREANIHVHAAQRAHCSWCSRAHRRLACSETCTQSARARRVQDKPKQAQIASTHSNRFVCQHNDACHSPQRAHTPGHPHAGSLRVPSLSLARTYTHALTRGVDVVLKAAARQAVPQLVLSGHLHGSFWARSHL